MTIINGDLLSMPVETIINAANKQLHHGGGIAGLISRKAGPVVQEESNRWITKHGSIDHKKPAYTSAGKLPFKYIIHAVGPIWGEGQEAEKLYQTVYSSLALAEKLEVTSVGIPAISTGIYGYPLEKASIVFFDSINQYYNSCSKSKIKDLFFVLFDNNDYSTVINQFQKWVMNKKDS